MRLFCSFFLPFFFCSVLLYLMVIFTVKFGFLFLFFCVYIYYRFLIIVTMRFLYITHYIYIIYIYDGYTITDVLISNTSLKPCTCTLWASWLVFLIYFTSNCFVYHITAHCSYGWFYYFCLLIILLVSILSWWFPIFTICLPFLMNFSFP